ncbi:MAG: hypothetical protein WCL00_05305, partial [Bacteroidota bacterium]
MAVTRRINKWITLILFVAGISQFSFSQQPHLSKKITIQLTQVSLLKALNEIGRTGAFRFSFDAGFIEEEKKVSIHGSGITVEKALKSLLGNTFKTREIGNHVILA